MSDTKESSAGSESSAAPASSWKLPDGIEDHIEAGKQTTRTPSINIVFFIAGAPLYLNPH